MESYQKHSGWDTELGPATSTETLGVRSASSVTFHKEKKRRHIALVILCIILFVACIVLAVFLVLKVQSSDSKEKGCTETEVERKVEKECITATCLEVAAAVQKSLNMSYDPCEDFFHYSCEGWIKNNPIPPSSNQLSTLGKAMKQNNNKLHLLLLEDDDLPNQAAVKKAKNYFKSCLAEDLIENSAKDEIKAVIDRFGSWPVGNTTWNESAWNPTETLLKIQRDFPIWSPLFEITQDTNPYNSSKHMLKIYPPDLSLIRETYLDNKAEKQGAYLDYMTKVGELLGGGNTTRQQMRDVMELEARLARILPPKSEIYKNFYRDMNLTALQRKAPDLGFKWLEYLNELLAPFNVWLNATDKVIVPAPDYLHNLSYVIKTSDNKTLSNYMMWTLVRSTVPYLSRDFRQALLEYEKKAQGKKEAKARWLSCVEEMNGYYHGLTFALGYMYVKGVFDAEIIPYIEEMMGSIKSTFREQVPHYEWIDDQTRPKIYEKEEAMQDKVGFPKLCANETLLNKYYEELNISGNSYLQNAMDVMRWWAKTAFSRLMSPVDKEQWFAGPQLVNAFYLPNRNEINILAGILQPPFYYGRKAPRAVNFGAIGMVLAHELSHGFDASGRYFNKDGEIVGAWWTPSTSNGFEERAKCIVDQYSRYSVDGEDGKSFHLDGNLTLSENIADNGGIRLAYWAYQNWVKKHGAEDVLPGLNKTNDQLLFVSFAQMWCSAFTPAAAFNLAKTDTHSLAMYRVIGPLSNMKEFSKAFNCPAGERMNPEKKCQVW